eukprot:298512-Pelagomonas_calceolata.AAC.1
MSVMSVSAAVRAQVLAPSFNEVVPHAHQVKDLFRILKEARCTIRGNVKLPLLECHKNTCNFCSVDGVSRTMTIGFYVQLQ